MEDVTYDNVVARLIEAVPELQDEYKALVAKWKDELPGCYIVYEDLFVEYIVGLSTDQEPEAARDALKRAFAHLEILSLSKADKVRCLVEVGVLESLFAREDCMRRLERYMGPATIERGIEYCKHMEYDTRWLEDLRDRH